MPNYKPIDYPPSVVPLYQRYGEEVHFRGSASLFWIRPSTSNVFAITAAHLTLPRHGQKEHGIWMAGGEFVFEVNRPFKINSELDFAAIRLSNAEIELVRPRISFVANELIERSPLSEKFKLFWCCGYPGRDNRVYDEKEMVSANAIGFPADEHARHQRQRRHKGEYIWLHFDPKALRSKSGSDEDIPPIDGLSGGSVWRYRGESEFPTFSGIMLEQAVFRKRKEVIKVLPSWRIVKQLTEWWPQVLLAE